MFINEHLPPLWLNNVMLPVFISPLSFTTLACIQNKFIDIIRFFLILATKTDKIRSKIYMLEKHQRRTTFFFHLFDHFFNCSLIPK